MTESSISFAAARADDLPVLTVDMILSGLSSQNDPFFVQVIEVLAPGPLLRVAMVRPALMEDVYEKLELDAVFTFSDDDAANGPGVGLLSSAPKPVSKILPDGVTLTIVAGVSVKLTMSLNMPKGHAKVKLDGAATTVDFFFTMEYESRKEVSLFSKASLSVTEEIEVPLKLPEYWVPFLDLTAFELLPFYYIL